MDNREGGWKKNKQMKKENEEKKKMEKIKKKVDVVHV